MAPGQIRYGSCVADYYHYYFGGQILEEFCIERFKIVYDYIKSYFL
ncbi:hypothetical protein ERO13_A11G009050v2 [Gossypium hirsutum]|uniref:Uncharacterized protein n=1 Tax=Gossypium darwinii TaxID=34276 RepID=A0A5D2EG28_GOSDA|nr:hypothetical protein ERO13_A11G009050v2 [Gossypium hirsutum]TYG92177.1 hypothetical protein ES288_A11G009800v1 [Gossypium darwinii]